jgi:glycine/D-amino acid oxidase-like deaminating enzyme
MTRRAKGEGSAPLDDESMPRIRYGPPFWIARVPRVRQPTWPRLEKPVSVDVAVIGGGLTGCATAYLFAGVGASVVLLEAGRIGQGMTGRSPGLLAHDLQPAFRDLVEACGLRAARSLWQAGRRASLEVAATLRRLRVRCDLAEADSVHLVVDPDAQKAFQREVRARKDAGIDVSWVGRELLQRQAGVSASGAIRVRGTGHLDPYRACLGLARAARRRGARIYEASVVDRVRGDRRVLEIRTPRALVTSRTVVVTTAIPGPMFESLARHFTEVESYCVLTPPLPAKIRRAARERPIIRDSAAPAHWLRWSADDRMLFCGADQAAVPARSREKVLIQRTGQLMYELSLLYPVISGIQPDYAWPVPIAQTADGLPYIGPHRHYPGHLFALGFGHNSVGLSWLAARILLRAHVGDPEKGDELWAFGR